MGLLVDGSWRDEWYDTESTGGRFERRPSAFRDFVRADGSTRFAPHIERHYYESHRTINPTGVVPLGPELDFESPHGRS